MAIIRGPRGAGADQGGAVGRSSIRDRLRAWRDRAVADPAIRRFVAAFPLTRPIARKKARQLFDLVAGFVYSQVLLACVRLDVFRAVAGAPKTIGELSDHIGLRPDRTERLVDAAISLGLLDRRSENRIGLGELGAALMGEPGLVAMVEHHALLYGDLADPVALLKADRTDTAISRYWAYAKSASPQALSEGEVGSYSSLMSVSQSFIASEVLAAYDMRRHRHLLDIGGGEGTFCLAAAEAAPRLRVTLFDLPAVAERARARFEKAGLSQRAAAVGGSFFADPLPTGADIATLVRVAYDHDDSSVRAILRAARAALSPGGVLLIAEPMAGTPGAEPIGDAYFGFYLLAMQSGRARTPRMLTAMLEEAGFHSAKLLPTRLPLQTRVLLARV